MTDHAPRAGLALLVPLLVLALAAPAHGAAVTLQPSLAPAGGTATVRGAGFAPRSRVAIVVAGRRVRTRRAGRTGRFAVRVPVPRRRPGAVPVITAAPRGAAARLGARRFPRVVNVLAVRPRRAPAVGAQVAASGGSRLRVVSLRVVAGAPVILRAAGRGAFRAWFAGGRAVTVRRGTSGLPAPARPGRARLLVRAGGVVTHVWLTVVRRAAPRPTAGPTTTVAPGDAGPVPSPSAAPPPDPPPPPPPGPPKVVAVGDIACAPGAMTTSTSCRHAETAALARSLSPDVVATLGDNQYEDATLADFQGSFGPTWGAAVGPLIRPIPGSHEYQADRTAAGYFDWFGAVAGDRTKGYYAYDVGSWRLIALNTSIFGCEVVPCDAASEQVAWFRDELRAHADRCTLAYWHHPRWSSGFHGNFSAMNALWTTAHDEGADVVLGGNDHDYERFAPLDALGQPAPETGVREFVVGTGGHSLREFSAVKDGSEARISGVFGVLELTLRDDAYDWRFVAEDGSALDPGTQGCRPPVAVAG